MIAKSISERVAKKVEDVVLTFALDEIEHSSEEFVQRYVIKTSEGKLELEQHRHPLADFLYEAGEGTRRGDPSKYHIRFAGEELVGLIVSKEFAATVFRQVGERHAELTQLLTQRLDGFVQDLSSNPDKAGAIPWETSGGSLEVFKGTSQGIDIVLSSRPLGTFLGVYVAEYVAAFALRDSRCELKGDEALALFEQAKAALTPPVLDMAA